MSEKTSMDQDELVGVYQLLCSMDLQLHHLMDQIQKCLPVDDDEAEPEICPHPEDKWRLISGMDSGDEVAKYMCRDCGSEFEISTTAPNKEG